MFALISSIRVAPEDAATLEQAFAKVAAHVRANEPGTLAYYMARADPAGAYRVIEVYRDEEAFSDHKASDAFQDFRPRLGAMLLGAPEVEKMDVAV